MAKAQNTFLGSKMNKDLDARLLQNGDYRDALNVQVSRSEGDGVGSLENVLGNSLAVDFGVIEGVDNLTCIGYFADDVNNSIYLFLTDYTDPSPFNFIYSNSANNFIYLYNTVTTTAQKLVEGNFLNFSKTNFIYGVNILEDFLFWTDNRNQPRKINVTSALSSINYYKTEDQISVSTYNPYQSIILYRESLLASSGSQYETTMLDVTSKFYPNGGTADSVAGTYTAGTDVPISDIIGNIYINSKLKTSVSPGSIILDNTKVTAIDDSASPPAYIRLDKDITIVSDDLEIVFEPNPYFENSYNGDPNYLEDKFVRFGYRFNFVDGENSIFSPFTQPAFVPKQDGYFITDETLLGSNNPATGAGEVYASKEKNNQESSYQSTIVEFMENKVNKILLYIPLPFNNYDLQDALKIDSIDILYKESNQVAVKVIEQVSIDTIFNSAGQAEVTSGVTAGDSFDIQNIKGGVLVGSQVTFSGSTGSTYTVIDFNPDNPSIPTSGTIQLSDNVTLAANDVITIGDPRFYIYDYQSRKPFKVLPEADLIRVYDKTPVRSLAQEITGNRIIYANFQNKHTPPAFLDYNVSSSPKAEFSLNSGVAASLANPGAKDLVILNVGTETGSIWTSGNIVGSRITSPTASIPAGTLVQAYDSATGIITLTNNTNVGAGDIVELSPISSIQDASSVIEYPNHSVKQNRNYQVGVVLSDRFGRQSSVILSNSTNTVTTRGVEFKGSTIYSPYNSESIIQSTWPGDSLKVSFNSIIGPSNKNTATGWPGLYNGDKDSPLYNPLGWYSWKIVVKQTEQEYYNVYLPGVMAAYPKSDTLELGRTSHTVLINDNINKIPRDLNEVGPQQKQFRSSVGIFGRVENHVDSAVLNFSENRPYYPGIKPDTVSVISTLNDLFDFSPLISERPDFFPQFYSYTSDPLIARITTENKIGQINSTNLATASAIVNTVLTPVTQGGTVVENEIYLADIQGTITGPSGGNPGMSVRGGGLAEGTTVLVPGVNTVKLTTTTGTPSFGTATGSSIFEPGTVLTFFDNPETNPVGIQYLAVYETEPTESLLDIFWETSSSGLISDLNTAISSDTLGAIDLVDFNDALFFEDLPSGSIIGNGSGFTVQDVFGADINPSDFEITLESPVPGEAAIIDQTGANRSEDFILDRLEDNAGNPTGFYQIKTASQFVWLEDPAIRNFVLNIKVENTAQDPVSETYFIENIELKNRPAEFVNCPSSPNFDPISTPPVPPNITILQSDVIAVNKVEARNGSDYFNNAVGLDRFEAGKELEFEIIAQLRANQLQEFGGSLTEQNVFDQIYVDPLTGYTIENIGQQGPFTLTSTISANDSQNNGVSFCTIEKPDPSQPQMTFQTASPGQPPQLISDEFQDWIVWLGVEDGNGSAFGSEGTNGTTRPYCRVVIRVERVNVEQGWGWNFITPRDINTGQAAEGVYIDGTCTVAQIIDGNSFRTEDITGDNAFFPQEAPGGGIFDPNVVSGVPRGPIFVQPSTLESSSPANGNEIYQIPSGYSTAPNSVILDANDNPILDPSGDKVRVSVVEYTNPGPPFSNDFGSDAIITTFTTINNLSVGDVVKFSAGRWLVEAPDAAGNIYTNPVFPRMRLAIQFPFYSPTDPTQEAGYSDLCTQVKNAFPQKTAVTNRNCDFESYPILLTDVTPVNPFQTFGFGANMVSSGQVGSGTINYCQENCIPGT